MSSNAAACTADFPSLLVGGFTALESRFDQARQTAFGGRCQRQTRPILDSNWQT
jgi:hypothetical protein